MIGPIFYTKNKKRTDAGIHPAIVGAINFTKSKAYPDAVKRGGGLGLSKEKIARLMADPKK